MELIDKKEAFNTIPKIIITPPRNGKMLWAELIDEWHKNMAELPIIESRPKCKDCIHYNAETKGCKRNPSVEAWEENDYCSYGEMRGKE